MIRIFTFLVLAVSLVLGVAAFAADKDKKPGETPPKAAAAEKTKFHLSPMIIKDVNTVDHFICGEAEITLDEIMDTMGKTFFPLMDKEGENGTVFDYPAIFIYDGVGKDPKAKFKFTTGYPVAKADAKPIDGFKIKKLDAFRCASAYYTGPLEHLGTAYESLYAQLAKAGHTKTSYSRELYLFWDGEASANTVIEIQVGIAAEKAEPPKPDGKKEEPKK